MKKTLLFALVVGLCLGLAGVAMAAGSDSQNVVVTVDDINEVSLATASTAITIESGDAIAGTATVSKSLASALANELSWTTNGTGKKITVAVTTTPTDYTLKVTGSNISGGTLAGEGAAVSLSDEAADFITGITTTAGDCDLQYTVDYNVSAGPVAEETNTVTYTIVAGT